MTTAHPEPEWKKKLVEDAKQAIRVDPVYLTTMVSVWQRSKKRKKPRRKAA